MVCHITTWCLKIIWMMCLAVELHCYSLVIYYIFILLAAFSLHAAIVMSALLQQKCCFSFFCLCISVSDFYVCAHREGYLCYCY